METTLYGAYRDLKRVYRKLKITKEELKIVYRPIGRWYEIMYRKNVGGCVVC